VSIEIHVDDRKRLINMLEKDTKVRGWGRGQREGGIGKD